MRVSSGYTFNPLSLYFCYRADGEPALVIYEVRNTFGDIHAYVPRPHAAAANAAFNASLAAGEHRDYTAAALSAIGREPGSRQSALVQRRSDPR